MCMLQCFNINVLQPLDKKKIHIYFNHLIIGQLFRSLLSKKSKHSPGPDYQMYSKDLLSFLFYDGKLKITEFNFFVCQCQATFGRHLVLFILSLLLFVGHTDHNCVWSAGEHDYR